jgi:hypothetical protein
VMALAAAISNALICILVFMRGLWYCSRGYCSSCLSGLLLPQTDSAMINPVSENKLRRC